MAKGSSKTVISQFIAGLAMTLLVFGSTTAFAQNSAKQEKSKKRNTPTVSESVTKSIEYLDTPENLLNPRLAELKRVAPLLLDPQCPAEDRAALGKILVELAELTDEASALRSACLVVLVRAWDSLDKHLKRALFGSDSLTGSNGLTDFLFKFAEESTEEVKVRQTSVEQLAYIAEHHPGQSKTILRSLISKFNDRLDEEDSAVLVNMTYMLGGLATVGMDFELNQKMIQFLDRLKAANNREQPEDSARFYIAATRTRHRIQLVSTRKNDMLKASELADERDRLIDFLENSKDPHVAGDAMRALAHIYKDNYPSDELAALGKQAIHLAVPTLVKALRPPPPQDYHGHKRLEALLNELFLAMDERLAKEDGDKLLTPVESLVVADKGSTTRAAANVIIKMAQADPTRKRKTVDWLAYQFHNSRSEAFANPLAAALADWVSLKSPTVFEDTESATSSSYDVPLTPVCRSFVTNAFSFAGSTHGNNLIAQALAQILVTYLPPSQTVAIVARAPYGAWPNRINPEAIPALFTETVNSKDEISDEAREVALYGVAALAAMPEHAGLLLPTLGSYLKSVTLPPGLASASIWSLVRLLFDFESYSSKQEDKVQASLAKIVGRPSEEIAAIVHAAKQALNHLRSTASLDDESFTGLFFIINSLAIDNLGQDGIAKLYLGDLQQALQADPRAAALRSRSAKK